MVRYDSLLVRHLARELDDALRGRSASALRLDRDARRASVELDDGALVLELHPMRGWITLDAAPPAAPDIRRLHRTSRVRRVSAPADERILRIDFDGSTSETRPIRSVVVELMTNQMNLVALADDDRIVAALWPRSAGGRALVPGPTYEPPSPSTRAGCDAPVSREAWDGLRADDDPARAVVRGVAWMSTLNAWTVDSYDDYVRLVAREPAPALVRRVDGSLQPYPFPIGADAKAVASLLEGMRVVATGGTPGAREGTPAVPPEAIDRVRREITRLLARVERMEAQRERARPQALALRARGDILLARLHEVPRSATHVTLADFEGGTIEMELDPKLTPAENARAFYDGARKRERAAERMPALISETRARIAALEELARRADVGEASAADIDLVLPRATAAGAREQAPPPPFRRYVTTGGLEVRVGRSGRANDELTFHHASPNDIWMHARDVAGAHVVLRWPDRDANPPQHDLVEAAVLAALHSRSRTSGVVPVDWTRRKYVRKPRKAPPGRVLVERAKTLFVAPDPDVERRLRPR